MIAAEGRAAGFEAKAESPDVSSVGMIPRALVFADCCGLDDDIGNVDEGGCGFDKLPVVACLDADAAAGSSTSMALPPLLFAALESFEAVATATAAAELPVLLPKAALISIPAAKLVGCFGCCCWGGNRPEEGPLNKVPPIVSFSLCFSSSLEVLPSPARLDMTFDAAVAFAVRSGTAEGTGAASGLRLLLSAASMVAISKLTKLCWCPLVSVVGGTFLQK